MYSPKVIERNIERFEAKSGVKLVRYSIEKVRAWVEHLASRQNKAQKSRKPLSLTKEEQEFILNERTLAIFDYRYHAERYHFILLDSGGLGLFSFWASQEIVLRHIAELEEALYEAIERGDPVDGILIALHKARQLGASMLAQSIIIHRATTTPHNRSLVASVDSEKVTILFKRSERIYENLPWWFAPKITEKVKGSHTVFGDLDSSVLLQDSNQMSGIAQGDQFETSHLTECSSWMNPEADIERHFVPTIPQSTRAFSILESTAQVRGDWWHTFCNRLQQGYTRRWHFVFVPWYAEESKYRAAVPENWSPSKIALLHAKMVYETSPLFCFGKQVTLSKQQLYWWESTRAEYQHAGTLNIFLTNYCATPEESFQHSGISPFPTELLEKLRSSASIPQAYELTENG